MVTKSWKAENIYKMYKKRKMLRTRHVIETKQNHIM